MSLPASAKSVMPSTKDSRQGSGNDSRCSVNLLQAGDSAPVVQPVPVYVIYIEVRRRLHQKSVQKGVSSFARSL